ncbi:MAG TPA: helix-turn-helix domain-containing protein [bacterium]|nr:helix-turn-helix domain-containing protein [bacterium]
MAIEFVNPEAVLSGEEKELERMLTVSEAAELLGVSAATVRRMANDGGLPCYRVGRGRHRRFKKKEVLGFLHSSRS